MAATYPGGIYSAVNPSDNSPRNNPSLAAEITGLNNEVIAIETALGVNLGNVMQASNVTTSGTPTNGQIIVASSSVAAQWQYPITVASVTTANAASVAAQTYNTAILANGTFNFSIPAASSGRHLYIKNVGSGSVGVIGTIDGAASVNLNAQYMGIELVPSPSSNAWYVIGQVATYIV